MARPQRAQAVIIPERPRRPVVSLKPCGPYGGDMKNPPETCKYRKMDADKVWWVEPFFCAYKCQVKLTCECFKVFDEGSKERKKFKEGAVEEVEVPKQPEVQNSRRRQRS